MHTGNGKLLAFILAVWGICSACAPQRVDTHSTPGINRTQDATPFTLQVTYPTPQSMFFECLSPCCIPYLVFELPAQKEAAQALAKSLQEASINAHLQGENYPYDYTALVEFFPQFDNSQTCKGRKRYFPISNFAPFDATLRVTIRHRASGEVTAQYEESRHIVPHFSFSARALSFLAPYTLGAFTPIQLQKMGSTLSAQVYQALQELLNQVVGYIQEDNRAFTAPFAALEEASLSPTGRYHHLLQSVAEIQNPITKSSGAAFFITPNGYLLTAAALVKGADFVYLSVPDGAPVKARVTARNTARNAALLKIDVSYPTRPLELESKSPHLFKGEKVVSLGVGKTPVTQGVLSGVARLNGTRYLLADTVFTPQQAGGPLIEPNTGRVLGINTGVMQPGLTQAVSVFELEKIFPQIIKEIRPDDK